ncbi:kinase-like domain-containing protein [Chytridium lagenaria]|nr:kinase-like domain-containing protein [Chytridium lagenaria]
MLGRGGFAFNVAIKIIDKRMMKANNESRKVASEVDIHFHLHHPSILELLTFFEDDDNVYLVMELCAQARRVLEQVVKGLEYLHERKIMHRDLKLSNILLTEDFDVKIADFGLACRLNDNAGEQRTMCGTPNYISPEVIMRHSYGPATDVWSLGCMFYTVLIGRPPFDSNVVKSTLNKVLSADFELPDYISPIAKDLIQKLLTKKSGLPVATWESNCFWWRRRG